MKLKESYTLEELCSNLTIPLVKLCQMAGITEATLIRLRKGFAGRQHTINSILEAFSKVYERDLSLENVTGLTVQEKPHQKAIESPVETFTSDTTEQKPQAQKVTTEPNKSTSVQKRTYKPRNTKLPDGCILASEFAESHNVDRSTFIGHMDRGLGPGLIHGPDVPEDGSVQVRDWVRYEERNKRVRKDGTIETERYLTPEQQAAALDFWRLHKVKFKMPE